MRTLGRRLTVACVVTFSGLASATAEPITFLFSGPVTFNGAAGFNASSVSGSYTFDSATPLGSDGQWTVTGLPYGFSLLFDNGFRYQSDTVVIATNNDLFFGTFDEYTARSVAVGPNEIFPAVAAALSVAGGGSLLPNAQLPLVPPSLVGASRNIWVLFTGQGNVAGPMTSFTVAPVADPVPEPASMMLVGGGLALLGMRRRMNLRRRLGGAK